MKYTIDKHERYVVIEPLTKQLNGEVAAFLKGEFMLRNSSGQRNIILDLSNVEESDEEGIRMGLLAQRLCGAVGGVFILTGVCSQIADLLRMAGLENNFTIVKSISKAEDLIFGSEIQRELRGE
ncbi:STAS domain-containing protein [Sphingobacterium pedocola]|uniref:Anti-anti-sigma factor n=1 Tax=Sphingobacterium pedocola TaxID=2082722 RepID=A0ABR9T3K4_9SPHI|nr:STAS domain-containing protein [Sphingobacterium pedocola]MBE8719916.1 anti-anti-sigma factor [Sphingobacterium pedocola]